VRRYDDVVGGPHKQFVGVPHHRSRPPSRRLPEADYPLQDLTGQIIEAFFHVHHTFGYGFLESVYRKTLAVELQRRGISIEQLVRYELVYYGVSVGTYEADLVVERSVILETKTGLVLDPVAQPQVLNYLRASQLEVGLVLHFGPRPLVKRSSAQGIAPSWAQLRYRTRHQCQ